MKQRLAGTIFLDRVPLLTNPQIVVISEILRNSALVMLGAEIIPYIFGTIDKPGIIIVILSSALTFLLFIISVLIVRDIEL